MIDATTGLENDVYERDAVHHHRSCHDSWRRRAGSYAKEDGVFLSLSSVMYKMANRPWEGISLRIMANWIRY
jgi:hypothetical protein